MFKKTESAFEKVYVVRVNETPEELINYLKDQDFDPTECLSWHPQRILEWLTGRKLIAQFVDHPIASLKVDSFGKPHFPNSSTQISLSHSHGLVALAVSEQKIGIDIQKFREKTRSLFQKFGCTSELNLFKLIKGEFEAMHILWSIKEAVYKAHHLRGLGFKNDIRILSVRENGMDLLGEVAISEKQSPAYFFRSISYPGHSLVTARSLLIN